jgi:hypothetical protein
VGEQDDLRGPVWECLKKLVNDSFDNGPGGQNASHFFHGLAGEELSLDSALGLLKNTDTPLQNLRAKAEEISSLNDSHRTGFSYFVENKLQELINLATMIELPRESLVAMQKHLSDKRVVVSESSRKDIVLSEVCLAFVSLDHFKLSEVGLNNSGAFEDVEVKRQLGKMRRYAPFEKPKCDDVSGAIEAITPTEFQPMPKRGEPDGGNAHLSGAWMDFVKDLAIQFSYDHSLSSYAGAKISLEETLRFYQSKKIRAILLVQGMHSELLGKLHGKLQEEFKDYYGNVFFLVSYSREDSEKYISIINARNAIRAKLTAICGVLN